MNVVFIHQNFSAQFKHLARIWSADPKNRIVAICREYAPALKEPAFSKVEKLVYKPARQPSPNIHHYVHNIEVGVLNGQAVAKVLYALKKRGFVPDIAFAHIGWGEALYFKEVFPDTPLVAYCEFYYHARGVDADFDPEFPVTEDDNLRIVTRNAISLLSLSQCDLGVSPMPWQKQLFPQEYQPKIQVIHDGIDVEEILPATEARFMLPNGRVLTNKDEVVSYAARGLEPYRGFHVFMRAVEEICRRRPNCQIVIAGEDKVWYGRPLPGNQTYREKIVSKLDINPNQVHFLGTLPYADHLKLLQVSSVHVYLTVPFVLSWSMLEAMATECVLVASATPPVQEVVAHGKNGLLVDFFAHTQLADAVDQVFEHPQRMRHLSKQARQDIINNYKVDNTLRSYQALYKTLVK